MKPTFTQKEHAMREGDFNHLLDMRFEGMTYKTFVNKQTATAFAKKVSSHVTPLLKSNYLGTNPENTTGLAVVRRRSTIDGEVVITNHYFQRARNGQFLVTIPKELRCI